jgi:benzyl alcohol O-benzoyltransferase
LSLLHFSAKSKDFVASQRLRSIYGDCTSRRKQHRSSRVQAPATMTLTTVAFTVRRGEPALVGPAAPTPRETKRLSDIDDQETLRGQMPFLFLYRGGVHVRADNDDDPACVIRRALGEALVPFYPLAGRLREVEGRKLVVDCTGEGVLFVEADADVRLDELEATGLRPPFPCMDQLLFDVDGSSGVLHCPLLLIQVPHQFCRKQKKKKAFRQSVVCDMI